MIVIGWLLMVVLFGSLAFWILYTVIRMGVRDGVEEALRDREAARIRSELGVGEERSPNQSS